MNNNKGFTLIEMLIVLLIITILIFVAIPNITKHSTSINNKGCEAYITMVQGQVEAYEMEYHQFPKDTAELVSKEYLASGKTKCPNGNEISIDGNGKVAEVKSPK